MIKLGNKEFEDKKSLSDWLENLLKEGESKMSEGKISALCYEDMIEYWDDAILEAVDKGELSQSVHTKFLAALNKYFSKPYTEESLRKAMEEYDQFGLDGLKTR